MMTYAARDQLYRDELTNWIAASGELNAFITLTVKQAIMDDDARLLSFNRAYGQRTAWLFRDRFLKAVWKNKEKARKVPFAAFLEGDGHAKRYHIHALTFVPSDANRVQIGREVAELCEKLAWLRGHYDVRPIDDRANKVIGYSLKESTDAFLESASRIPFSA